MGTLALKGFFLNAPQKSRSTVVDKTKNSASMRVESQSGSPLPNPFSSALGSTMKMIRYALAGLLLSLSSTSALAGQTWWIDDSGGAGIDFTDIQPAINAASAGDLLIVHPGTYSGFNLGKNLTIMGFNVNHTSVVNGTVTIANLTSPGRAVLTGLRLKAMNLNSNGAPVILDSIRINPAFAGTGVVTINNCFDVRMYQCNVTAPMGTAVAGSNGVEAVNSRLEVVDSYLAGAEGFYVGCSGDAGDGGSALWASNNSIISVFQTTCDGGPGGQTDGFCEWSDPYGGDGGDGIYLRGGSRAVIAGDATDTIMFGWEGWGDSFPIFTDGARGYGMALAGGSIARYSGVNMTSTLIQAGSLATLAVPADPYLERTGTLQAGRKQTFWIYGTPGDQVTFYLGRSPLVTIDGTQEMDNLVTHERAYTLGAIPATGRLKYEFTVPTFFPDGFSFYSQAEVTTSSGSRLTNSIPIVLRYL